MGLALSSEGFNRSGAVLIGLDCAGLGSPLYALRALRIPFHVCIMSETGEAEGSVLRHMIEQVRAFPEYHLQMRVLNA